MNKRVLFVDDEPNILQAIKRAIRKDFDVFTAVGPEAGLKAIAEQSTFALIVSDMRMPGMNGVEFLRAAKQISPQSVRIMLTGNSDQKTAMDAVNTGEVFRFLTKPCDIAQLRGVVTQGLRHHQLLTAEEELLEQTLKGSLTVLSDLLALARPDAFGRTCRLKSRVLELVGQLDGVAAEEQWAIETATMLSQLGSLKLSTEVLGKINAGELLSDAERDEYEDATIRAAKMLECVPRMEPVARIIAYQHKHYSGDGAPADAVKAEAIPLGARALHLVLYHDDLRARGFDKEEIAEELQARRRRFDPRLLDLLMQRTRTTKKTVQRDLPADELEVGMLIEQDVSTDFGSLLVCEGQRVTPAIRDHLVRFFEEGKLSGTCKVSVEVEEAVPLAEAG